MNKINWIKTFLFVCFLCLQNSIFAQSEQSQSDSSNENKLYLIVKINNVEYVGNILSDDGREVLVSTQKLGKIYIPKSEIKSIEAIKDSGSVIRNEYYGTGPFTTRYIFTTNGLPIRKGQNYARINLYGPEAHFALSDNFSIGLLTTWSVSPFILSLKYSIATKNPKINCSVGTLLGSSGYINDMKTWGGLHYGTFTYGTSQNNISFGAGFGYIVPGVTENEAPPGNYYSTEAYSNALTTRNVSPVSGPVISFSGITKVGAKASFVFDSMITFGSMKTTFVNSTSNGISTRFIVTQGVDKFMALILMPGMRFQIRENNAFQLSLNTVKIITNSSENITFPLPSMSWFYKF